MRTHAKLHETGYAPYPEPIFEDDGIEDVLDFAEDAEQTDGHLDKYGRRGTVAFATFEEARAAGVEFNNKGRLCRVCRERTVIGALDTKCPNCELDQKFVVEDGKFEMTSSDWSASSVKTQRSILPATT